MYLLQSPPLFFLTFTLSLLVRASQFVLLPNEIAIATCSPSYMCVFVTPSVEYLGHFKDKEGIQPLPNNVAAILQGPQVPIISN